MIIELENTILETNKVLLKRINQNFLKILNNNLNLAKIINGKT